MGVLKGIKRDPSASRSCNHCGETLTTWPNQLGTFTFWCPQCDGKKR
jgi:formamidopyrimidine-DNA glycosylase